MNDRSLKLILIIFSVVFLARVATIFTADRLYSMSFAAEAGGITPVRAINLVNTAIALDNNNADLCFRQCELLQLEVKEKNRRKIKIIRKNQLHTLKDCIALCPSWPRYHLYYALVLKKMAKNPNPQTRELILSELKKAAKLKPFSKLYRDIYGRGCTSSGFTALKKVR